MIDDSKFENVYNAKIESYTGDHVKKQLQWAYESGHNTLMKYLKERFTEERMYEACAILREYDVNNEEPLKPQNNE